MLNRGACNILAKTYYIELSKETEPLPSRLYHVLWQGVVENQRNGLEKSRPPDRLIGN